MCLVFCFSIHNVDSCLPLLLLTNTLNKCFNLFWCVELVPAALVKDLHLCGKYKPEVHVQLPEFQLHVVVLSALFLYLHRQVWKKHDMVLPIHHFSLFPSCSHYSDFVLIVKKLHDESARGSARVLSAWQPVGTFNDHGSRKRARSKDFGQPGLEERDRVSPLSFLGQADQP